MTQTAPMVHAAWPGRALGRYRCIGVLGLGSCGVVFRARDRACGRDVAIKLPRAPGAGLRWVERARVLREGEALGAVRHPNVVGLHEVGLAGGLAYLVMQALDAAPLVCRLDWRAGLAVGLQIGAALASVHAAGLVHRDVAPRNILVDASGRAWLIDFGLARAQDPARAGEEAFVGLALAGSRPWPSGARFTAPEQRRGEPVDGRADQYGLCATLWRGIVGAGPEAGPVPAALLPAGLAAALLRGLDERPERRHADMQALLAALAGCGPT